MAKRRRSGGRKSAAEARVERLTWFFLVLVFAAFSLTEEGTIPNAAVPFAGAVILLGSGGYQFARGWHVSPLTWLGGFVMLTLVAYSQFYNPNVEMIGPSLITFAIVILFGTITNET